MAKYTIRHACGHLVDHQLYGSGKDRDRRACWLMEQPCLDCKREAARATAEARAEADHLPALVGSERQVAWALTIRAAKLAAATLAVDQQVARVEEGAGRLHPSVAQRAVLDAQIAALRERVAELGRQADARWWIDRRDIDGLALLRLMTTPIPTAPVE